MRPDGRDSLSAMALARRDALIAATQALVRIDTQTPPSDTSAAAALAAGALNEISGVDVSLHASEPPIVNVVARLKGDTPGKRLVLSGHLDTYPIGERAVWTQEPLGGAVVAGRLYGRGSADMKGGCAVLIEVVRLFAERLRPFSGEIVLAFAGDEERMGELGTQWLIDTVPDVRGDGVLVADVGGPAIVRLGEKGMLWLELTAAGRQAHGAHVHAGENAIDRLLSAIADLRAIEGLPVATPTEAATVIANAAQRPGADDAAARAVMTKTTFNLGMIAGGASSNLVPSAASAGIDIRIPLGVSTADVKNRVFEILRRHQGINAEVTRCYEATWTSVDDSIAEASLAAARDVSGETAHMDMRIGGSDARLWRRAGMPTVVLGLTPRNLGAPDESLLTEELTTLLNTYLSATSYFLGSK